MHCEVKVTQSCLTLCNPIDYSLPGSSVHGIFQAGILEWVAVPFFRRSSPPRVKARSPTLHVDSLLLSHQRSPRMLEWVAYLFSRGTS